MHRRKPRIYPYDWGILDFEWITITTDKGRYMIKAVKLLEEKYKGKIVQ